MEIFWVVISLIVIILLREVAAWYNKTNIIIQLLTEIRDQGEIKKVKKVKRMKTVKEDEVEDEDEDEDEESQFAAGVRGV